MRKERRECEGKRTGRRRKEEEEKGVMKQASAPERVRALVILSLSRAAQFSLRVSALSVSI